MFSSAPPAGAERRARGGAVRRSQSRAGSIAALAAGSNAGTPPPLAKTGPRPRGLSARAGSSRRQSLLPPGRTASRQSSRLSPADPVDEGSPEHDNAVLYMQDDSAQNEHEGVLLKSDTHAVTILGGLPRSFLPAEVIDVLANSDFYTDPHTAVLDTKAGYACLAGKTKCYVWSLEGALQSETDADPVSL